MLPELERRARINAYGWWKHAISIYGERIGKIPEIIMNSRLTSTAGRAFYTLDKIDLSVYLMKRNEEHFYNDTIPHELAHIIAWRIHQDGGHGKGWKSVMVSLGLEPLRCHNLVTKHMANSR